MSSNFLRCTLLIIVVFILQIYASCGEDCRKIVDSPPGAILVITNVERPGKQSGFVYQMNLKVPSREPNKKPVLKKLVVTSDNLFEYKINLGSLEEGDSLKRTNSGSWERFYN